MDDIVPVSIWEVFGGMATLDACAVEEDGRVDFWYGGDVLDELAGVGLVGEVGCDDEDFVA